MPAQEHIISVFLCVHVHECACVFLSGHRVFVSFGTHSDYSRL